jgi:hypothetical protein
MRKVRWDESVKVARDIGEFAKLIALAMGMIVFLSFYFPGFRQAWEVHANPHFWFQIGQLNPDRRFRPRIFESPIWAGGVKVYESRVGKQMPNTVMTTEGDQPHIGRAAPGTAARTMVDYNKDVCLYVAGLKVTPPGPASKDRNVWAEASRVTC